MIPPVIVTRDEDELTGETLIVLILAALAGVGKRRK